MLTHSPLRSCQLWAPRSCHGPDWQLSAQLGARASLGQSTSLVLGPATPSCLRSCPPSLCHNLTVFWKLIPSRLVNVSPSLLQWKSLTVWPDPVSYVLLAANRKLIYFLATRNRFNVLFTVTVQFNCKWNKYQYSYPERNRVWWWRHYYIRLSAD